MFDSLNTKIIALSVDKISDHIKWIEDINETQKTEVTFPIIDDSELKVSNLYGMIHPEYSTTMTVRSVFIIDPLKKVRLTLTYPASTGRNFNEIIRIMHSLQLTDKHALATPVNWKKGDKSIVIPALTTEDAQKVFENIDIVKPYLRYVETPTC